MIIVELSREDIWPAQDWEALATRAATAGLRSREVNRSGVGALIRSPR